MAERKLTPEEVSALGLDAPEPATRKLSDAEVAQLGLEPANGQAGELSGRELRALESAKGMTAEDVRAALNGVTMGYAPKIVTALDKLFGKGDTSAENAALYKQASDERPLYDLAGAVALPLPGAKGANVLVRAAKGALLGGGIGGAAGYARGGETGALEGAGAGLVAGAGLPLVGAGLGKAIGGLAKRSEAAKYLISKGVKGLTIGQQAPGSALAQLEEAGQSVGVVGPAIEAQRAAPLESWRDVSLREALPQGMAFPPGASAAEKLRGLYGNFEEAYAPIKAAPVASKFGGAPIRQAVSEGFRAAADDPTVLADQAQRSKVAAWLENQATILDRARHSEAPLPASAETTLAPIGKALAPAGPRLPEGEGEWTVPAGLLLKMRSNVRKAIGKKLAGTADHESADLLSNAEGILTNTLNDQLPPEMGAKLRDTDARYRLYKTLEKAVARSGDQAAGFTPSQLSAAVKAGEEGGSYARGAGGELRRLAQAGKETFDQRSPPTGHRLLAAGPLAWAAAPFSFAANHYEPLQNLLLGETAAQQKAQALVRAMRGDELATAVTPSRTAALIQALREQRHPPSMQLESTP